MPGLDGASRSAITKVMQEWREAFDECAECEGRIASLAETVQALEVKSADAANREGEVPVDGILARRRPAGRR